MISGHEFGLGPIGQIGVWRYRDRHTIPKRHAALLGRKGPIDQRSVTKLLTRCDEFVALQSRGLTHLRAKFHT